MSNTQQNSSNPRPQAVVPARAAQEREQRRRRDDLGTGRLRNLAINGELDPNYEYRWVNDDPGRMYQLTQRDDWDVVSSDQFEPDAKDKSVGSTVERVVDKRTGKRAVLVRKKKEWYRADKAKEQAGIDETEAAIKRGATPGANGLAAQEGAKAYVPPDGIHIATNGDGKPYTP